MSASAVYCETCAQALPADCPLGTCPNCLLQRTLNPQGTEGASAGPYRLLELIGEGAFGEVYIGEQSEPVRREAAVKLLKSKHFDSSAAQRFQAEAQALTLLDHPNIARLYEAGTTGDGQPYIAIELVSGATITSWCDQLGADLDTRIAMFRKVCSAIAHAHQRGLIHRDLKPENILVDPESGDPKVIDFGIARSTSAMLHDSAMLTGEHEIVGTPAYLSPEQTDGGNAPLDERSDIYALGSILYELLTGTTTLSAMGSPEGHFELLRAIRETEPPPANSINTEISSGLAGVISRAIAKKPEDRFSSVVEFEAAIGAPPVARKYVKLILISAFILIFLGAAVIIFSKMTEQDLLNENTPAKDRVVTIHGEDFSYPLTLVQQDFITPTDVEKIIPPFDSQSQFSYYQFRDRNGRELVFAVDLRHDSPSSGEFIFGAKAADLFGARHVELGSPDDTALIAALEGELPNRLSADEIEKLDAMDWVEGMDRQTRLDKRFLGTLFDLRNRREFRKLYRGR